LEFALGDAKFSMPVGRVEYLHIEPMSFEEFLLALNEDYLIAQLKQWHLGEIWPANLHAQASKRFREYLMVGGMPEAVAAFAASPTSQDWSDAQESILRTYRDDFIKYGKKSQLMLLHEVFGRLSGFVARKIKYSELAPHERAATTRAVLELLDFARVVRRAIHSDAQGLPVGATGDSRHARLFMVDVGLVGRGMGIMPRSSLFEDKTVCEGALAEQFVAQHLATFAGAQRQPGLHYWRRDVPQSQAEVDFLVQHDRWIIPVEVKSGETGTLRSLHQFMISHPNTPLAVKLCGQEPRWTETDVEVLVAGGSTSYRLRLLSLPLYMIGQLGRLLSDQIVA
jgi:predicted AAA+ superfamily ATPase